MQKRKILFLCPYPNGKAPSQRFRYEQYLAQLEQQGYEIVIKPFFKDETWNILYQRGRPLQKAAGLLKGLLSRFGTLFSLQSYSYVFVHREAAPVGPPVLEWIISKLWRKRLIYDFDDAIWLTDVSEESTLTRMIKWRSKVGSICNWAYCVSCGNEYLLAYARRFSVNTRYNPTTIDTNHWHNPALLAVTKDPLNVTIGWTGSHSTLKYLELLAPVLVRVQRKHPQTTLQVIADHKPDFTLPSLKFIQWNKETEIADLLQFDIGIMPMPDDEWTNGKCGFKALQYMALEIPVILSPVGVNTIIVENGVTGIHATTDDNWYNSLCRLIEDSSLRREIGRRGRQRVTDSYSVESNSSSFLSMFV